MPPILRGMLKTRDPGLRVVAGSFVPGVTSNLATYTFTLASGTPANRLVVTAKAPFVGDAGNALTFDTEEAGALSAVYAAPKTTLTYVAGSTTLAQAVTAINAISGGAVTAAAIGTGSTTFTGTTDLITPTALSGAGTQKGRGFSVAQAATGTYRVTLDKILQAFHMVHATVQVATAKNLRAVVGPIVQASKYFDIYTLANATLTDGAATDRINFLLFGRDVTR